VKTTGLNEGIGVYARPQRLASFLAGAVYPLLAGSNPLPFTIQVREVPGADERAADFYPVTLIFFTAMKIRPPHGRDF
jgi:hypothetical protein